MITDRFFFLIALINPALRKSHLTADLMFVICYRSLKAVMIRMDLTRTIIFHILTAASTSSSPSSSSQPSCQTQQTKAGTEFTSFPNQTRAQRPTPLPLPELCTTAFNAVFQTVGIMTGTSVGLGIAWTDWVWRDGAGKPGRRDTTITRWEDCRDGPLTRKRQKIKWAEQIQYLNTTTTKTMPQPAKT